MNDKSTVLDKYHNLSQEDLQDYLASETNALFTDSAKEQVDHLHELHIYQLELEMQNRELRKTHLELEIARDKYVSLYDFAPVAFLTLGWDGRIKEINMTGSLWLANKEPADLVGESFIDYISENGKQRFHQYLQKIQTSCNNLEEDEFILRRKNRSKVNARMHCMQYIDTIRQEKVCYMAILDLTKQRTAEHEAEINREALTHLSRLAKLGEMASALAHEVSQPITALITYIHILRKKVDLDVDGDELKEIIDKITTQANRSSGLLHQIRDFSRRQKLIKSRQSIKNIIEKSIGLMHAKLTVNDIKITLICPDELPDVVVDETQIMQVIVNIISNAVDSILTTDRAGYISLVVAEENNRVKVSIEDNGAGVATEVKEKLFMPFTTGKENGLGVGLSLSRSIIESFGGQIWFDPNYENGAKFVFTLPFGV